MLSHRLRIKRRGAGLIYFAVVMLPVLLASFGFSVDTGRLLVGHRQVADTADSVALAAAHAFNNTGGGRTATASLNAATARSYATQTFNVAKGTGKGDSMLNAVESPTLKSVRVLNNNTKVEVTIEYKMTGFIIMDYLTGSRNSFTGTVTRSAQICSPSTSAYCGYPVS